MKLAFRKIGTGKPLFILHGLFGSSDNWQTLGKQFADYFTVYFIDLRNHGRSPHSEIFNYNAMSEDLQELTAEEGIEKLILLGHSLGGKAAMHFTIHNTNKVEKLIVADMGIKKYTERNQYVLDAIEYFNRQTISSRKEAEEILETQIPYLGVRQFLLKNLYRNENQKLTWRFNFNAIKNNINNVGEPIPIPSIPIEVPALFVKGEKSDYILYEDMEQIMTIFPLARLEVIPSAGHWLHADNPQAFFKTTMQFILPSLFY